MKWCVACETYYEGGREITCSDTCHEILILKLERKFGKFKKVVRSSTGVAYRVPLREIAEKGLREQDLDRYPVWKE